MAWRFRGRAKVSISNPRSFGSCDRCSFWYQRDELRWQFEWNARTLYNTRLLVCDICYDKPFEHFQAIVVPPDPVPIMNPRPDLYQFAQDGRTNLMDQNQEVLLDTTGAPILATPNGTVNTPPYPFAGFTMLRSDWGGTIAQVQVRDDAYSVQSTLQNDVQVSDTMSEPVFSTTPMTGPNTTYNNQNRFNNPPGQTTSQYGFPVVFEIPD
jgi:hypothetical protein